MVNLLRPSGALLAAVALWAVGLLVLGLAGLGGRVGPHPANPALAPPVPHMTLQELDAPLGTLDEYAEVGQRPLLNADRRPAPVAAAADGVDDTPLEATLTSVLIAGETRLAIVQNKDDPVARRVRVGDLLEGTSWRLVDLQPRRAVFEGPTGQRALDLRVFDGTGAPMPPAPVVPVAAQPAEPPDEQPGPVPPPVPANAAPVPAPLVANDPAVEMTPEQQVEAIRRRIEARRAMRAQEGAEERAAMERAKQVE